ncbi:MAG: hypothetical protein Q8Q29_01005 [Actinomycetota bacterium]|jgi:hypothetical protein|nr:hypothetical protein [Actinomycetota bacterium]
MRRGLIAVACAVALAACGGGSELSDLAAETCAVLADPETSLADSSLILFESTATAIGLGYTEAEFAAALRAECPDSVIIGGDG